MNAIDQIDEVLRNTAPEYKLHLKTETDLLCRLTEMGVRFEIHITARPDGSIVDRCDEYSETFNTLSEWKAQFA